MSTVVRYLSNKACEAEIAEHLSRCDSYFVPPLSGRIKIGDYAEKIASIATRFEAWSGCKLVGLLAGYCNDWEEYVAYITSVSVLREWMHEGIANALVTQFIEHARAVGMRQISLEVAKDNIPAITLYKKNGFVTGKRNGLFVSMDLHFRKEDYRER